VPGLKFLSLEGIKGASNAVEGGEAISVTAGTVETFGGSAAAGISAGEGFLAPAAAPVVAVATGMDLIAHQECNNPGSIPFGPILF
jgi:hypothetical protein